MNILILTQTVDINNPVLGFFHNWIKEFSKQYKKVTVICLECGEYKLPKNVKVLSLGKENGRSIIKYIFKFYFYIWNERKNYDMVFVHMNQEYVLLAGDVWRFMGKKVYLWRNHATGNMLTRLAIFLANKVFYTSPKSFTAKFKKAVKMPVGIDTDFFIPDSSVKKIPKSILFLGRIAPVKRVVEFIDWFREQNSSHVATIAGESLPKDKDYEVRLRKLIENYGLASRVKFVGAVTHEDARRLYRTHEIYVNLTPAGSMDKTIFEASACETKIIVENKDLKFLEELDNSELRKYVVENHSLNKLFKALKLELK